jgi:hypothetical protein
VEAYTVQARTARKPHLCDNCHWTPNLRGVATILPGHRYLRHTTFPDGVVNQSNHPVTHNECVACAIARLGTDGLLLADACSTYCCGELPCALPHRHQGDHSCRRCAKAASSRPAPAQASV